MQQEELLFDKLGEHEERLVRIEGKIDKADERLVRIELDVHDIKNEMAEMATKEDLRLLQNDILEKQDFLHKKLNDIHTELAAFNRTWLRHENELNKYGQQIRQLQIDVAYLKPQPNIS